MQPAGSVARMTDATTTLQRAPPTRRQSPEWQVCGPTDMAVAAPAVLTPLPFLWLHCSEEQELARKRRTGFVTPPQAPDSLGLALQTHTEITAHA